MAGERKQRLVSEGTALRKRDWHREGEGQEKGVLKRGKRRWEGAIGEEVAGGRTVCITLRMQD